MKIVVVADPLPSLVPAHDSTVALIEAAQRRGHAVLVTTAERLPFDAVWFTPRLDDEDPCERFREQLEGMRHP